MAVTSVQINWGNSLTRGLVLDWSAVNPLVNQVDGQRVVAASPSPINALQIGRARDFTNAVDGDTSWGPTYWPLSGETQFTVEAYFRQTASSSYANLVSKFDAGGPLYLRIEANGQIGVGSNQIGFFEGTPNSYSLNTWTYVCATYFNGIFTIYINGKLDKTSGFIATGLASGSQNLQIGQNTGGGAGGAPKADIAFARLRKVALSPAEVWALAQNPWQVYKPNQKSRLSRLISLPNNLTLYRSLIVSNGRITQLPAGQENTGKTPLILQSGAIKQSQPSTTLSAGKFLPQRWRKQPQRPVEIDWSNPITRGLKLCTSVPINSRKDLASQRPLGSFSRMPKPKPTPNGLGFLSIDDLVTVAASNQGYNQFDFITDDGAFTAAIVSGGIPANLSSTQFFSNSLCGIYFETFAGDYGYRSEFKLQAKTSTSIGLEFLNLWEGDPVNSLQSSSTNISTEDVAGQNVFFASYKGNTASEAVKVSIGGAVKSTSFSQIGNGFAGANGGADSVNLFGGSFGVDVACMTMTLWWHRELSLAEKASMQDNPWQIFRPSPARIFSLPIAGTSSTPANALILKDNRIQTLNPTTDGLIS